MKTFLLVIVLVGAGVGYYVYTHPDVLDPWVAGTALETKLPSGGDKTQLYKWRDADGSWQVTDRPPPGDVPYETLEYRHDVNILPLPPELQKKD